MSVTFHRQRYWILSELKLTNCINRCIQTVRYRIANTVGGRGRYCDSVIKVGAICIEFK